MPPRVVILGTRYPDFLIEEEVLSPTGAVITAARGLTGPDIIAATVGADVAIAGSLPRFTAHVLEEMDCRAIVRAGIGVDSVDLEAARRLGKWVVNVPDYGTDAVALHTLTMVLACLRRLTESDRLVRSGGWGFAPLRPMRLPASLTAGVVGFGRIGRAVAAHFTGVGFGKVVIADPFVEDVASLSLAELLAVADVVTLHAPGPHDGSPLIGPKEMAVMPPGSILVNTARGSLIDMSALGASMATGKPGVAALDVFSPEPPDLSPLSAVLDRVILTPHTAWYTEETQTELRVRSAWEARRILEGEEPHNVVVRPEEAP